MGKSPVFDLYREEKPRTDLKSYVPQTRMSVLPTCHPYLSLIAKCGEAWTVKAVKVIKQHRTPLLRCATVECVTKHYDERLIEPLSGERPEIKMRSLRLLSLMVSTLLFSTLLYMALATPVVQHNVSAAALPVGSDSTGRSFFPFRTSISLFTPTATISLTDDNSTFFAAKPAAFGPLLPLRGLSGEIWIGSGFGDDGIRLRGLANDVEGELGCSDIPGWRDRDWDEVTISEPQAKAGRRVRRSQALSRPSQQERDMTTPLEMLQPEEADGTDDHFQYPLGNTLVWQRKLTSYKRGVGERGGVSRQANIQSIQETAEITGKIVLLSRGGCGFSEKVKWAQRRGAVAVIIGDNVIGGPLIQMYARDDTRNITIPSLFTSHTTAHLLSTLIPTASGPGLGELPLPKDTWRWIPPQSSAKLAPTSAGRRSVRQSSKHFEHKGTSKTAAHAGAHQATQVPKATGKEKVQHAESIRPGKGASRLQPRSAEVRTTWRTGRLAHILGCCDQAGVATQTVEDGLHTEHSIADAQDRQGKSRPKSQKSMDHKTSSTVDENTAACAKGAVRSGSITPGSGVYEDPCVNGRLEHVPSTTEMLHTTAEDGLNQEHESGGWLRRLFNDENGDDGEGFLDTLSYIPHTMPDGTIREGLWVTLTPTDMNNSPFLNTLFVLVVSPLFTLAIVYAMLLCRSRIRRRRWRAPKSVVERLPVRIYHALSRSASTADADDAASDGATSSATPLLAPQARAESTRDELGTSEGSSFHYGSVQSVTTAEQEKIDQGLAEWKRKYGGRQVECVVCLEEYVDGDPTDIRSTPWLTTRRRTCPICKGDVVRSFHRYCDEESQHSRNENATNAGPRSSAATHAQLMNPHITGLDDIQSFVAETRNDSPSAALPVPIATSSRRIGRPHLESVVNSSDESPGSGAEQGHDNHDGDDEPLTMRGARGRSRSDQGCRIV
ncbi:hypothetical protein MRB53_039837 [Persea americana]|nr:hypothetical protein MRB53_039837 [Persea americana]